MTQNPNAISHDLDALLCNAESAQAFALVRLNGYRIEAGGPLGDRGVLQSFVLLTGDVWEQWDRQQAFLLQTADGRTCRCRIAALPAEAGSTGLIEFLG